MKHPWEAEHSYAQYETLERFLSAEGDGDMDHDLIFRWDWREDEGKCEDPYYRNGELRIFFMTPGKRFHRSVSIRVRRADERKVIEFLMPRLDHHLKLWGSLEGAKDKRAAMGSVGGEPEADGGPGQLGAADPGRLRNHGASRRIRK